MCLHVCLCVCVCVRVCVRVPVCVCLPLNMDPSVLIPVYSSPANNGISSVFPVIFLSIPVCSLTCPLEGQVISAEKLTWLLFRYHGLHSNPVPLSVLLFNVPVCCFRRHLSFPRALVILAQIAVCLSCFGCHMSSAATLTLESVCTRMIVPAIITNNDSIPF